MDANNENVSVCLLLSETTKFRRVHIESIIGSELKLVLRRWKIMWEKEKNADHHRFLLFPQHFQKLLSQGNEK